jgi:hypothetical protein
MRGALTAEQFQERSGLVRDTLSRNTEPHWQEFLAHWQSG